MLIFTILYLYKNKTLVLLSDNYPCSNGEFFLDDEINIIASNFEKITILCISSKTESIRTVPDNVDVIIIPEISRIKLFFYRIKGLFFLPLWQELFLLKKRYDLYPSFLFFKILLEDYAKSSHIIQVIVSNRLTDPAKHILYSYWYDYKALAIARIRNKSGCRAISRCHRWDVYFYANNPPFLPYRQFLFNKLTLSCSISQDGVSYIRALHKISDANKLVVCRLGKINEFQPRLENNNKEHIVICSCSMLIHVKRVHLIVEFISKLSKSKTIKWIHFGDGKLKENLISYASTLLEYTNFDITGIKPNDEIMKFYKQNYVDLFINFSESEGIPVSIMEAQSAGIPVLATAVGGVTEIVNNENGFIVDKDFDMDDVIMKIRDYLSSSQDAITAKRQASYDNWNQKYNAKKNYKLFAEELLGL